MKRAFYDFAVSPYSFDFAVFCMAAKAADCDQIVIVPGQRAYQKCTPGEQEYRLSNLILGLEPKAILCQTRGEAKTLWHEGCFPEGYTVENPIASHLLKNLMGQHRIHPYTPSKEKIEEVEKDGFAKCDGEKNRWVTITIRDTHIKQKRNSNIKEWIKAADWMKSQGMIPVFIPDTEHPDRQFGEHLVSRKAALDVQYRIALYEQAYLNAGVNNGPMVLNFFSRRPMLYFKPVCNDYPESTPEAWRINHFPVNSQPPWFSPLQRIVWEGIDTFENIKAHVEKWLRAAGGDKDAWPPSVAPNYPIKGVMDGEKRAKHMEISLSKGFPYLEEKPLGDGVISIVCYGPSLKYTWDKIKRPILTVSGAHDFLIEKGVIPDYHVDCDPREHKAEFLTKAHPCVKYLMASVCHPKVWEMLEGKDVSIWHLHNDKYTDDWLRNNAPSHKPLYGGSTVGMRALEVARCLGYKNFEIHGMDNSFEGEKRHAGKHNGKAQSKVEVFCDGVWYPSSPQMIEAAKEMVNFIYNYDVEITFYGEGLQQAMVNHFVKRFRVVPMENERMVANG